MARSIFDQTNPTVSQSAIDQSGIRMPSRAMISTRLKKFFKSEDFQNYCNLEENGIKEGRIIRIVSDTGYIRMEGTSGPLNVAEDFDYAIVPEVYHYFLYKSNKVMDKKQLKERSVGFSQSYLVRKDGAGMWIVELLLANGKEAKQENVKTAFDAMCAVKGYRSFHQPSIYQIKRQGKELYAWVSVVSTKGGGGRVLSCLIDNGELLDLSTQEVEIRAAEVGRLETPYNRFHWTGEELVH